MKIAVLGDGAWGSALANLLDGIGHEVRLWGPFPEYIDEMRRVRSNPRFLPQIHFSDGIIFDSELDSATKSADIVVLALPSKYMRSLLEKLRDCRIPEDTVLVNIAKGLEENTLKRMGELVCEQLGEVKYATLSGPSHAEEVMTGTPTAVVVASTRKDVRASIQNAFMNKFFRVYCCDDIIGVELGGAFKNVYAIAAGIIDGLRLGDNPKAALVARGLAELTRLGRALGGKPETFSGLSGLGDLIVTCYSRHSRNRHVGEQLGGGETLDAVIKGMGMVVAEGVVTVKSANGLALRERIDAPIVQELYNALYMQKSPRECIQQLMERPAKPEVY